MKARAPILLFFWTLLFVACEPSPYYPKPKAFLALDYAKANYRSFENDYYKFPISDRALVLNETPRSIELWYPKLNASIFINYNAMEIPLQKLIEGVEEKLSEHQSKATAIVAFPYEDLNVSKKGVLFEIKGNTASAAQFYVTDSKRNFMNAALYFNVKPHYDSVYPAAQYLLKDLRKIISGVSWK